MKGQIGRGEYKTPQPRLKPVKYDVASLRVLRSQRGVGRPPKQP